MFRFHVQGETNLPDPGCTPSYDQKFFNVIKFVKRKTPLNPVHMTVKQWYLLLLEENVTKREVDQDGRTELIPCRVEEKYPEVCWPGSKDRLHHLNQAPFPLCRCNSGD